MSKTTKKKVVKKKERARKPKKHFSGYPRERLQKCGSCGALKVLNGACRACGVLVTTDVTAETNKD